MGKVVILDENTANQIAAGEVIERPASIVKEMVENSLDANATSVTVEITNGGIKSIRIVDNGDGIDSDDVEMAFERHATSKIRSIDDLGRISTMGFRGEALASIASVSKVEVITKTEEADIGTRVLVEGGMILSSEPMGAPKGTTFIVRELFYNTPARYKFLKRDATEAGYIHDIITRIALARPDVSMKFINQGKTVIHTPGNHDLLSTIYSIFGKETACAVIPLNSSYNGIEVLGYIGKPEISRGNRSLELVFVNGRSVYNKVITAAIEEAYKTRLMQKRFPFTVLKLNISPESVDVNVHPAKLEVRFSNEQQVFRTVNLAVTEALSEASLIQNIEENGENHKNYSFQAPPEENVEQINMQNKSVNPVYNPVKSQKTKEFENKKHSDYSVLNEPIHTKITENFAKVNEQADTKNIDNFTKKGLEVKIQLSQKEITAKDTQDDRERLLNTRIIGQAFESYIILEEGEDIFLIDQHAAHERIRFEKIKKDYSQENPFSQGLLSPLTVELTELEMQRFNELEQYIKKLGFDAEAFGNRTVLVRAIPYIMGGNFSSRDFIDILGKLSQEVNSVLEIIPEETIFMMACKSAIKANRSMSSMEIENLLKDLVNTKNPYTCVHGRPIIISVKKKELEKKFKRIV